MQSWSVMRSSRANLELRPLSVRTGINIHAEGSALVELGQTRVQATVSVEPKLPPHLRNRKDASGWLTAEYAMLPRSTSSRVNRERLYPGGRNQEIQRLISRSLRAVTRLDLFRGQTLTVDVDVLQADGGTRCAGIIAGYAALFELADSLIHSGRLDEWPLTAELAAVSVGLVGEEVLLDLDAAEDQNCQLDLNVVGTASGELIEVQGGSEAGPIAAEKYVSLVGTGVSALAVILERVRLQIARQV